jgi:murein DD-endopeptidase MepM/ murein hydrolase activator NlpD
MQLSVLRRNGRNLSRGAAVLVLAGLAAGCSSTRFGGIDDFFTASTPNQREIIRPGGSQPYPGSTIAAAPIEAAPAGSVSRSSLPPAGSSGQMTASAAPAMQAARPLDQTSTGTIASTPVQSRPVSAPSQAVAASGDADPKGWSRTGGTQVTVKEGETIYNLSRRFGVPANAIMAANGITEAQGLRSGQQIVVPTYVYSSKAPVSAPDSHPKVAAAKSSRGEQQLVPPSKPAEQTALAAPKPAAAKPTGGYVVQSGDTLSSIARKTGVSSVALKQANGLSDGAIRIGQTLTIPAGGKPVAAQAPVVAAVGTSKTDPVVTSATPKPAQPAGYTPPKKSEVIQQASLDTTPAPVATGIGKMRWPARGRVIAAYGKGGGRSGDGIDIAVPEGTSVKAAENGVVIYAGDGLKEFGNTVLVRHENGLVTVYGHASELKVTRGQTVKRGQEIAVSGMSGQTDSPKLHFEVRKNSAPVDPSTYLE